MYVSAWKARSIQKKGVFKIVLHGESYFTDFTFEKYEAESEEVLNTNKKPPISGGLF